MARTDKAELPEDDILGAGKPLRAPLHVVYCYYSSTPIVNERMSNNERKLTGIKKAGFGQAAVGLSAN